MEYYEGDFTIEWYEYKGDVMDEIVSDKQLEKDIMELSSRSDLATHHLIDLAEKYLAVKGMPKKKNFSIEGVEEISNEGLNQILMNGYNQCHDDFTLALVKKLERLESVIHSIREWQALHLEVQADILQSVKKGISKDIKDYLLGEQQ